LKAGKAWLKKPLEAKMGESLDLLVVGGGISGLAIAYFVSKERPLWKLLVCEKAPVVGGTMQTSMEEGFIVEHGPNGFLTNKPHTLDLCRELKIEEQLMPSSKSTRRRFIYTKGRLREIPLNPAKFLFASNILSPLGKLRLMGEAFVPPLGRDVDESLSIFAVRRLGREALEQLLDPMVAGVYAGNPDEVSLKSTFPTIHQLERKYGGLIKGMLALRRERKREGKAVGGPAGPSGELTSFKEGVHFLPQHLSKRLGDRVLTGCPVERIDQNHQGFVATISDVGRIEAKRVVIAAPAYAAAKMLTGMNPHLAHELAQIPYAPMGVVALGYRESDIGTPKGFGLLVPRREGLSILGVLWDSSIFPNRAERGNILLRVMIGGARQPQLALKGNEELVALAKEGVKTTMGIKAEPVFTKVFRYPKAIPQYVVGHSRRLERVEEILSEIPGLFLGGNAYRGIGLNDCVKNAKELAELVLCFQ
jgi:oxygen-dependent protoporphyrinogen oxidase